MYKSNFGTQNQIHFNNEHEFYELLGYLAKSDGTTSLVWEHNENQGAWGSEGRIHLYTNSHPFAATLPYSAGVGKIIKRVNCNEFVENLNQNHCFVMGASQNIDAIRATIPSLYLPDFERGLQL
ncbi:MAG: hypothetical protein MJ010_08420 [Paludibacteraceae bacterium]|nr:hypothetical protein [Paludibacteraceae bacterium]